MTVRGALAAAIAVNLVAFAAHAGPRSQSGFAGAGGLLVVAEPGVEVLSSRVAVRLDGDDAEVSVRYLLRSATARSVRAGFPVAVRPTESDGPREPKAPWRDAEVRVGGAAVPTSSSPEPEALGEYLCGDPLPGTRSTGARAHLLRARVDLPAGTPTEVELRFRAAMAHDDWVSSSGAVERSPRVLCLRPRPLRGFAGPAAGLFGLDVDAGGSTATVFGATAGQHGRWRIAPAAVDLLAVPDVVISVD